MYSVLKREFVLKKLSITLEKETESVNESWILPSWVLMLVRLIMAVFCVTIIINSGVRQGSAKWFIYLTNWAYFLLTITSLGLSLVSVVHLVQLSNKSQREKEISLEATADNTATEDVESALNAGRENGNDRTRYEKQTWYPKLVWLLWIVSSNAAIIISLNYWILIFTPPTDFMDIAVHALNMVVMLIELFLGSIPVHLLHLVYVMAFAIVYGVFTVVYWAAGGTNDKGDPYIYKVLDFDNGNPGTVSGALLGTVFVLPVLAQLILFGLYQFRCYLKRKTESYRNVDKDEHDQVA